MITTTQCSTHLLGTSVGGEHVRLTVELIPRGSWGANLRSLLPKSMWDRLRKWSYEQANNECELCGETGLSQNRKHRVECHEIWEYDDNPDASDVSGNRLQILRGLQSLCPYCHACKHMGLSISRGGGYRALKHFMKVNECTPEEAQTYINHAFAVHAHRSIGLGWDLDLTYLRDHPALTERDQKKLAEIIQNNEGVYMGPEHRI